MAAGSPEVPPAVLGARGRVGALRDAGLTAAPDADMDRLARMVTRILDVPVALVSLVEEDRQVFPGMVGLAEPWAGRRQTPLSHSLCRYVVASARPLVLADAREHDLTCTSPAIPDLDVVAYAGMPLTDADGHVLGSLCAIDGSAREWTDRELQDLADLAESCSAGLRLRIASRHARDMADQARRSLASAEVLLRAAEDLTGASSLTDVRRRVRDLVGGDLRPAYVGLVLAENGRLRRVPDPDVAHLLESLHSSYETGAPFPTARAFRERRTVAVPDRGHLLRHFGPESLAAADSLGLQSSVSLPLVGTRGPVGALTLGWAEPHRVGLQEQAVLTSVAAYTAQAVERAVFLEERVQVARRLQHAMLTDLPSVPGLDMAALYLPAAADDMVGGDWYDSYRLSPTPAGEGGWAVTVGDITGHDVNAAAVMGQVRAMLRQATLDHPGQEPSTGVNALERACARLSLRASGTLVHAHLDRRGDGWELRWTNAGHPPPLLHSPDGGTRLLEEHDALVHHALGPLPRTDHRHLLAPGSTLLLYTDGLVERRGTSWDAAMDRLAAALSDSRGEPLPELLDRLVDRTGSAAPDDDVVLLALRPRPAAGG
ncbi:SpoIIE family protein phosphatase [Streptacidiphilus sp. ASG 303]|uniref:GAF domain-containing SpoIIE family protein phosphatase n=1 Tax=Streptacidiphilus sp. ASG 303 TaxID=2896847 RepID=UPI001E57B73B|nr:SpoIIE family protein phosphatase [Streptacidiphilus sp. ASG 303]MCD0484215.1 SpoIIE family protein phosphatase [Streptacidiphilus sp. ASG 303]